MNAAGRSAGTLDGSGATPVGAQAASVASAGGTTAERAAGAAAELAASAAAERAAGAALRLGSEAEAAEDGGQEQLVAIGVAACRAGVSERTLRYYEQLGLVTPAAHSPGGSRRYGEAEIERVQRIRELQQLLGLNLEEIRALLERDDRRAVLKAAWESSDDPTVRRAILEEAIAANARLRERLTVKRDRIDAVIIDLDERLERYRQLLSDCVARSSPPLPGAGDTGGVSRPAPG